MQVVLKGFPTEISDKIELPDIAELLLYPMFFDTDIEDVYKYGTDFHRYLIDKTPLRNTKRHISVLSQVRFIGPYLRSCTGNNGDPNREWHIDCEENEDGRHIYHEERDIVHLLTNEVTSMTEFNENEIIVPISPNRPYDEFITYIYDNINTLGIKPKKMPANRIVTFTNHLHRATDPERPEFKFMFRIVETDRLRPPSRYEKEHMVKVKGIGGVDIDNIYVNDSHITIYVPQSIQDLQEKTLVPDSVEEGCCSGSSQCEVNNSPKMTELVIDELAWETNAVSPNNPLYNFTPKNSIMLISNRNFKNYTENMMLKQFLNDVDRYVQLVSEDGEKITTHTFKGFFDDSERPMAGTFIYLSDEQAEKVKSGKVFSIHFYEHANVKFVIKEGLKFKYPQGSYYETETNTVETLQQSKAMVIDTYDKTTIYERTDKQEKKEKPNKVVLKGFPTEIGDYIELPDIAELLTYPQFLDCPAEEVWKYGTDFQKKLLSMAPLRNNKKYVTVYSQVKFLDPYHRSCTGLPEREEEEWHIDSIEDPDGVMRRYYEETDVVHLLTSKSTSMTEFNLNEIVLDFNPQEHTVEEFYKYLYANIDKLGIIGAPMPHNRFVTFTNHLHRARPSKGIEFKFMFRIVETDRLRPPSNPTYNRELITKIVDRKGRWISNIQQLEDRIVIYLPETISRSGIYLPKKQ